MFENPLPDAFALGYPDGIPDNLSMLTDFGLRAPGQRLPVALSCCAVGARDGDAITRAVVLPQTLLICGACRSTRGEDGHSESN